MKQAGPGWPAIRSKLEDDEVPMNPAELKGALEAIIYAADEPATIAQMASAIGVEKTELRPALDELVASYAADNRGTEIREVAGGFKFYTKPQHHEVVRRFIKSLRPPLRLTLSALETLAVIAYKQPVTQPEIQEIRGVNSSGVLQTLLEKRLITTAGRKAVIGRPILYRTSKDFLMRFGLSDVDELPSLKEFEQLARQALGTDEGIAPIEPEDLAGNVELLGPEEPSLEIDGPVPLEGDSQHSPEDAVGASAGTSHEPNPERNAAPAEAIDSPSEAEPRARAADNHL
jgi:segregation and condensation protein B